MSPDLWNKVYYYIEESVTSSVQDDIDSDFAVEVYEMGKDLRELVAEVWKDIDEMVMG